MSLDYAAAREQIVDRYKSQERENTFLKWLSASLLALVFCLGGGLVYVGQIPRPQPWIVYLSSDGIRLGGPATAIPMDQVAPYFLRQWLTNCRSMPSDFNFAVKAIQDCMRQSNGPAATALLAHFRTDEHDPRKVYQKKRISITITSVLPWEGGWSLDWIEEVKLSTDGSLESSTKWHAMVQLEKLEAETKAIAEENPLGLYITGLSWQEVAK